MEINSIRQYAFMACSGTGQDAAECAELNKIYAETMCVKMYIYLFSFAY